MLKWLFLVIIALFVSSSVAQDKPELPTLFIIGDSTVRNNTKDQVGWGDPIKQFFDRSKINVENHAIGGRSSRSFRNEGRWEKVLSAAKPGDFVLIQFGHNDSGPLDDEKARGSIRSGGDESKEVTLKNDKKETVHSFGWYMRQYVIEAKAKGMHPIVCSYIPRAPRPGANNAPATMPAQPVLPSSYALWAKEAAEAGGAEFIGLNQIVWEKYASLTPDEIKSKYFSEADYTHTNAAGAKLNAECVVEGIRALKDHPLKQYLLPEGAASVK